MTTVVKILIVEHDSADLELILRQLQKSAIVYKAQAIATEEDYRSALEHFCPDIILCDYNLPSFNGAAAFNIQQQVCPGVATRV